MTNVNVSIDPVSPMLQQPVGGGDREGIVGGASLEGQVDGSLEGRSVGKELIDEHSEDRSDETGERNPKAVKRPNAPMKAQIAEHFPCHAHYRSWCPDCCAGRSVGKQHRRQEEDHDDRLGPVISLDYAFQQGEDAEDFGSCADCLRPWKEGPLDVGG